MKKFRLSARHKNALRRSSYLTAEFYTVICELKKENDRLRDIIATEYLDNKIEQARETWQGVNCEEFEKMVRGRE